jgi:hypothetical protein
MWLILPLEIQYATGIAKVSTIGAITAMSKGHANVHLYYNLLIDYDFFLTNLPNVLRRIRTQIDDLSQTNRRPSS